MTSRRRRRVRATRRARAQRHEMERVLDVLYARWRRKVRKRRE